MRAWICHVSRLPFPSPSEIGPTNAQTCEDWRAHDRSMDSFRFLDQFVFLIFLHCNLFTTCSKSHFSFSNIDEFVCMMKLIWTLLGSLSIVPMSAQNCQILSGTIIGTSCTLYILLSKIRLPTLICCPFLV